MERLERLGEWWLPDNPDRRLTGTLQFSPEDGVVRILGRLAEDAPDDETYPILLAGYRRWKRYARRLSAECSTLHSALQRATCGELQI